MLVIYIFFCLQNGKYQSESDIDGLGLCPYNPEHNSTAIFVGKIILF